MGAAVLSLCLWLSSARAAEAPAPREEPAPFDPSQYPFTTLEKTAAKDPCGKKGGSEIKDKLFSAELRFQGSLRKTPVGRFGLVKKWCRFLGDPGAAPRYGKEMLFSEGRRMVWLAVPEGLLDYLKSDLQSGDRAMIFGVYVGCSGGKPVFAIDEFDNYAPDDQEAEDYIVKALLPEFGRLLPLRHHRADHEPYDRSDRGPDDGPERPGEASGHGQASAPDKDLQRPSFADSAS
jgi:hypothetical protein